MTSEKARWAVYHQQVVPLLSDHWREVFSPPDGAHTHGDETRWGCPLHGGSGERASFSLNHKTLSWHCHAGCGAGNAVEFLVARDGVTSEDARDRLAAICGVDLEPVAVDPAAAFRAWCETRHLDPDRLLIVHGAAPRLTWWGKPAKERPSFEFSTPIGVPRVRFLDGAQPKCGWLAAKERERRGISGKGAAHWYGLAEALEILRTGGDALYLVNGEPSVWACLQSGVPAICPAGGEGGTVPRGALFDSLPKGLRSLSRKARVAIVFDLDQTGREGAQRVAAKLREALPAVEVLLLPDDLGEKGDVDDLHRRVGDAGLAGALAGLRVLAPPVVEASPTSAAPRPPRSLDDLGNGERLRDFRGEDMVWIPEAGWHVWTGQRWAPDGSGQVERWTHEMVRAIPSEAEGEDKGRFADLMRHASSSSSARGVRAAIECARPYLTRPLAAFDADPWALAVNNGVLDLRTGALRPARREDLIIRHAPVDFVPGQVAPRWEAFLAEVMPDPETRGYLQRLAGYCLTGSAREHCVFLLLGPGRNGKGVFTRALCSLLGQAAVKASFSTFLHQKVARDGGAASPDLAALRGRRLVVASEPEEGARWNEALLKDLAGGDPICARELHRSPFNFDPTFKLLFSMNLRPATRDLSYAFWERIRLVEFKVTIPPERRDKDLDAKLQAELPGILNWAIKGCLDWQSNGLAASKAVADATDAYHADTDTVGRWIAERVIQDPEGRTSTTDLFASWSAWCEAVDEVPHGKKWLGTRLEAKGFRPFRTKTTRGWCCSLGDPSRAGDASGHVTPPGIIGGSGLVLVNSLIRENFGVIVENPNESLPPRVTAPMCHPDAQDDLDAWRDQPLDEYTPDAEEG